MKERNDLASHLTASQRSWSASFLNHYVERCAPDVLTISLRNDDNDHGSFALIPSCSRCIILANYPIPGMIQMVVN